MAATRACLVVLVVALAFLFFESTTATDEIRSPAQLRRRQARSLLRRLNKPPVTSIESPEGDIIDCVHILKQPAFDHPSLKNHTIKMRPSYDRGGLYDESNIATPPITQTWHQNGNCPENTIPIRRTMEEDILRAISVGRYGKKTMPRIIRNLISVSDPEPNVTSGHLHAVASAQEDKYYGTNATINLWQPTTDSADFSLAQLWITGGSYNSNDLNTIEAGWQVYRELYGDNNTRFFIYWTDPKDGNWWLQLENYVLGYWPSSIFSYLADNASYIMWGSEVYCHNANQTSTKMGSGHFPEEGIGRAAYIKNIQVIDSSKNLKSPNGVQLITERPNFYNVQSGNNSDWGTYIYYGGPGNKNPQCP